MVTQKGFKRLQWGNKGSSEKMMNDEISNNSREYKRTHPKKASLPVTLGITLQNAGHNLFSDWDSADIFLLDIEEDCCSKMKKGLFNIPESSGLTLSYRTLLGLTGLLVFGSVLFINDVITFEDLRSSPKDDDRVT